jgi:hypothetical protein
MVDTISAVVGVVVVVLAMQMAIKMIQRFMRDYVVEMDDVTTYVAPQWPLDSFGLGVVLSDSRYALDFAADPVWVEDGDDFDAGAGETSA